MTKRDASPSRGAANGKARAMDAEDGSSSLAQGKQPRTLAGTRPRQDGDGGSDAGMGEFEDAFEDEFEEEHASDEDDEDEGDDGNDDGEGGMEIDGVRVDDVIRRPEDEEEGDEEGDQEPETKVYIPGVGEPLAQGQKLEPDQSAYEMLHRLNVTWPCLSFDVLQDHLGSTSRRYPHTAYFVSGTQADTAKNNELLVMRASSMHKTQKDGEDEEEGEDDDDDDDNLDDDAILEYKSVPHLGGINRVRAAPIGAPSSMEPSLDPYPVATWSELGKVDIWDVRPMFNALERPQSHSFDRKSFKPMHTVSTHGSEGYALDWAGGSGSTPGRASSLRLLSGDCDGKIFLTTSPQAGFTTHGAPFTSHTSSVEDLQWSPKEPTVFASCSADRSIRIWDVRVKSKKSVISVGDAHDEDVNVISWNKNTDYLLLSGGDEGSLKVWDLRNFKPSAAGAGAPAAEKPLAVATFNWHTAPISSVEWHPTEDSVFAASGRDDQVTLWDLSVEEDEEEAAARESYTGPDGKAVPHQLLFCHQGASEIKEVHWHPQVSGMLMSTSADGFHLFKTISV